MKVWNNQNVHGHKSSEDPGLDSFFKVTYMILEREGNQKMK